MHVSMQGRFQIVGESREQGGKGGKERGLEQEGGDGGMLSPLEMTRGLLPGCLG